MDPKKPSPPSKVLDRALAQICAELSTVSYVRAIRLSSETAHLKPGSSPPEGEGRELAHYFKELYAACNCNWDRLLVIRDAQFALRELRYSPEKALVRGTREWKVALASDKRISVEVAVAYGVSSSYVRQLRVQLREGKLDTRGHCAALPRRALGMCSVCGMPVSVTFDEHDEIKAIFAPCGHPSLPEKKDSDDAS